MAFEYLAQYITFDSVADMDKSVEDHIAVHYYDLTESERAIIFKLASHSLEYPGVCHLKASTIAASLEISTKTVYRSMKKLAELGIIEKVPSTKLNGIKGASIYRILPYVPSSVSQRDTAQAINNDAVSETFTENQSSKSFNHLSFKTSTLQEIYNNAHTEKEAHKEYMNEYQVMLFDFMNSLPLADNLKDELHKVVLASQVNSVDEFIKAKNVLFKIAMDIKEGILTVTSTLRAVFVGAFNKAVERSIKKVTNSSSIEETPYKERPVPFYNWLNERDSLPQSLVHGEPSLDNWLEW
ncbi:MULTISPECIES: helix-turn-helix domain-containing protein [Lysinibacillus]|uniref:helix-turn-helix domain-containing protein n=1 Tax=Lysinibacillus TaxID=400634 RepID=UPI001C8C6968|nr:MULTISPECIES: helix-turn-helix domain-containing protein [Lysinibacillus]MBX8943232.1 helix-turn-helix domain-containing protein [Lysinibacillus sp. K60]UUV23086.1 helix-turn-helix domain-containing protein [Lysinibacillus sp. FN11]UYB45952.1 helix-turn-helix domain-containing protein [Lysinibacillus capsici]WHP42017.1 helix-turn-helix domain-containing protein [Lysinibacillus boronitolerans]